MSAATVATASQAGSNVIMPASTIRSRSCSADLAADGGLTSSDPTEVREWLLQNSYKKQISLLDKFLIELRRGRMISSILAATASSGSNNPNQSSTSLLIAHRIVNLIRHMIGSTNWRSAAELLCFLRGLGRELQSNGRGIIVIGNIVRRIMAAVREETEAAYAEEMKKVAGGRNYTTGTTTTTGTTGRLSLESMLWALPQHVRNKSTSNTIGGARSIASSTTAGGGKVLHHQPDADRSTYERQESVLTTISNPGTTGAVATADDTEPEQSVIELFPAHYYTNRPDLKQVVMEGIQEILTDLEDLHKNINEQATNHIHTGEVILTIGQSKTIELFLKSAAKSKRIFQVIVVISSSTPTNQYTTIGAYEMAKSLAEAGIETTVINESAVFAVMARVHKVLLPARAVLANGGLVASVAGSNLVAVAAQHHSVPVQCITGLFKLCPRFPHEGQDTLNDLLNTGHLLTPSNGRGDNGTQSVSHDVEYINPAYDYIEPKHIGLYITNVGSFQPSFIYRMLAENYHTDDWDSFE